jgi:hypothetical protein
MEVIELLILQGNTSLSATFNGMNSTISRRKQDTFELATQNTLPACDSAQYMYYSEFLGYNIALQQRIYEVVVH